jgi:outer membrane receptor protein involved in Fe transport
MWRIFLIVWTAGLPMGELCAQPPAPVEARPPEIIVTGERVDRSILETASSVVVMNGEAIDASAADQVDQLLALTPNVQLGSGTEGPTIRGQDSTGVVRELFAFLGGARPRATLTVDGRAAGFHEYVHSAASIWDVERVEIFRSPQTTTQGRNSIAGAIFVNTSDPTYDWEGRVRGIVGDFGVRHASAVVSGPIVANQLAIRASGDIKLGRNSSEMADGIADADIDRDDYSAARIKLLAEPRNLPGLRLEASFAHTESQAPQFETVAAPFEERRFPVPLRTNGVIRTSVDSLTALINYKFDTALTAKTTLSYGDAKIDRFGLPGLGRAHTDSDDFSLESVLSWQPEGPMQMLGGAHYLTLRQVQTLDVTGLMIGTGGFRDRQASLGIFGETTWRPAPRLAITTGLRYQRDRQDRAGQIGPVGPGITLDYDETFDAWLPKVSISYDITETATAGILVQRAYNPGGTTISLRTRREDSFAAETLWNYEAFARASFAGGRATLAANLFYNDMSNAQRPQTVEFVLPTGVTFSEIQIANAPAAESYGFEIDLGWRAGDRLSIRAGLGLLETEIRRTLLASDPIAGKAFQRAPNVSASAGIDWRPVEALRLSAQLRANSAYFSDDANDPALRVHGSALVNARAAYTQGSVTVFGFVRNIFDEFVPTSLIRPAAGAIYASVFDPREVGVGIEGRF